ncbi:NAD(P)H-hydrate dehydratase [uncultured Amnibacterium sp.]|uniref:ADP-dependent NAD(P)H-hydrate dehydratase n=1 Tax=uncultured Amnibacterium sp. TaxID=1631851 RepID=UPI0035CC4B20
MAEEDREGGREGGQERFGAEQTRRWIGVPQAGDDKYSRGVLGIVTGSDLFPGAAVLGVEGAARTGTGMVRYLGPQRAADFVLQRRPEVVTADGRVQAWLIGSGMPTDRDEALTTRLQDYLGQGLPTVLDAGALDLAGDATGPVLLTPHYGELAALLDRHDVQVDKATIAREPARWAARAARTVGATVLLKGSTTFVADPAGLRHTVTAGPPWVATAGAGDVLGGVLGALLATHEQQLQADPGVLADLAAAGAWLHGEAGRAASLGAPIAALDIAEAIPEVLRSLLGAS